MKFVLSWSYYHFVNSWDTFTHILLDFITGTGAVMDCPNPHEVISMDTNMIIWYQTKTKHNNEQTVYIILGIFVVNINGCMVKVLLCSVHHWYKSAHVCCLEYSHISVKLLFKCSQVAVHIHQATTAGVTGKYVVLWNWSRSLLWPRWIWCIWLVLIIWCDWDWNWSDVLFHGWELRNGVNGFLTSYATDYVRFSQQILDI